MWSSLGYEDQESCFLGGFNVICAILPRVPTIARARAFAARSKRGARRKKAVQQPGIKERKKKSSKGPSAIAPACRLQFHSPTPSRPSPHPSTARVYGSRAGCHLSNRTTARDSSHAMPLSNDPEKAVFRQAKASWSPLRDNLVGVKKQKIHRTTHTHTHTHSRVNTKRKPILVHPCSSFPSICWPLFLVPLVVRLTGRGKRPLCASGAKPNRIADGVTVACGKA